MGGLVEEKGGSVSKGDGWPPFRPWQEQNRLLNVGRQVHQIQDLRDPSSAHLTQPCEIGEGGDRA